MGLQSSWAALGSPSPWKIVSLLSFTMFGPYSWKGQFAIMNRTRAVCLQQSIMHNSSLPFNPVLLVWAVNLNLMTELKMGLRKIYIQTGSETESF